MSLFSTAIVVVTLYKHFGIDYQSIRYVFDSRYDRLQPKITA